MLQSSGVRLQEIYQLHLGSRIRRLGHPQSLRYCNLRTVPRAKFPKRRSGRVVVKYHRHRNCKSSGMTRVLLLEDSPDVLYLLQVELECSGYEVEAVMDAGDALRAAKRTRPDIIVSDLGLPGMDGF